MDRRGQASAVRYGPARVKRRVLFVVSRERPDRFDSLTRAFSGDDEVHVIFDRRHLDRRQQRQVPLIAERRQRDRRSAARAWALRMLGWVRVAVVGDAFANRRPVAERS